MYAAHTIVTQGNEPIVRTGDSTVCMNRTLYEQFEILPVQFDGEFQSFNRKLRLILILIWSVFFPINPKISISNYLPRLKIRLWNENLIFMHLNVCSIFNKRFSCSSSYSYDNKFLWQILLSHLLKRILKLWTKIQLIKTECTNSINIHRALCTATNSCKVLQIFGPHEFWSQIFERIYFFLCKRIDTARAHIV